MKTYQYKGYSSNGAAQKGIIEADNIKEARRKLVSDGIFPEKVTDSKNFTSRLNTTARSTVYRELSTLLRAGIPLAKAFDMLIDSPDIGNNRIILGNVRDQIKEGSNLASAFSKASKSFKPFELAVIESAEETGSLDLMFDNLATFLEEKDLLQDKIKMAMIYPSIIMFVGVCVAIIMLVFLLPKTAEIIGETTEKLPAITNIMMNIGTIVTQWGIPFLAVIIGAIFFLRQALKNNQQFKLKFERNKFKIPIFGRAAAILANLRFASTMSMLLSGGVSVLTAFKLSGKVTGNQWLALMSEQQALNVEHGGKLSDSVRQIAPLAESLPSWIQVGEATGELPQMFQSAAERYSRKWDKYISRLLNLMEPVLILTIGAFVLLVVLAVLLPILSLTKSIGT
jgi:general secretion pathway protein F